MSIRTHARTWIEFVGICDDDWWSVELIGSQINIKNALTKPHPVEPVTDPPNYCTNQFSTEHIVNNHGSYRTVPSARNRASQTLRRCVRPKRLIQAVSQLFSQLFGVVSRILRNHRRHYCPALINFRIVSPNFAKRSKTSPAAANSKNRPKPFQSSG